MTKKLVKENYKPFIDYCLKTIWDYQKILNVTEYVVFVENEPDAELEKNNDTFEVHGDYPYKKVMVSWSKYVYEQWFKKKEYNKLRRSLLHETLHLVLEPLFVLARERFINEDQLIDRAEEITEIFTTSIHTLLNKIRGNK